MARRLETVEGVSGLEVGVVSDVSDEMVTALTQAASGELPVIMRLPMERSIELASAAIQAGAVAVSLAPPRGIVPTQGGELLHGRLYGPAILPLALRVVHELTHLGIPTIGAGGITIPRNIKMPCWQQEPWRCSWTASYGEGQDITYSSKGGFMEIARIDSFATAFIRPDEGANVGLIHTPEGMILIDTTSSPSEIQALFDGCGCARGRGASGGQHTFPQ